LVRWTFVHEAAARLQSPGKKASASRIAAATGLTRSEVSALLNEVIPKQNSTRWVPRAIDSVLAGWTSDGDFLEADGTPRKLSYSDSECGFQELVRRYSRDIPPRALLNELLDGGLVAEISQGVYQPVLPVERASQTQIEALASFGIKLNLLGTSLLNNSRRTDGTRSFEALLLQGPLTVSSSPKIARDLQRRCQTFSQSIERFLMDQSNPAADSEATDHSIRLGVLVAVVEQTPPTEPAPDFGDTHGGE
jgi:hypothetical protein